MKGFMYAADLYCEKCGENIREQLLEEQDTKRNTDDSDEWPQEVDVSGEADSPWHCGSGADCLEAEEIDGEKYGKFLENDLTEDGIEYVRDKHDDEPTAVTRFWMDYYKITPASECPECHEERSKDCSGEYRCEICDEPCPMCDDGGGPGGDDDTEDDEEPEMDDDDYKLTPCGSLGGKIGVSQSGKFLADFGTTEEALEFVKEHMDKSQFFPDIWWISDHGNAWMIDLQGNEIKTS